MPAAIAAQARLPVSPATLKICSDLTGETLADQRYPAVADVVQRDMARFQMVRELDIDPLVEPAVIFVVPRSE
jgi:hypothetical protein